MKAPLPRQGAGVGSAAGTGVTGKRPEGTEKGALDPDLKEESETEVRCSLRQGSGGQ